MDITMVSPMDHFRTRRRRSPSLPCRPVALVPTARFWGEIIFPRTPPEELAPTVRLGLSPIWWAVTFWRLANSAFEEVSEPVSAHYRQYRPLELVEGLAVPPQRPSRAPPQDGEGDDVPDQDDGPRRG